jgi:uncharacterized protein YicC (UPF0701 family)
MPLRRTKLKPEQEDEGGFAWYRWHRSDEELSAVDAAVEAFVQDVLVRAREAAATEGIQLAELLNETSDRLQDEVVQLLRAEPAWPDE